MLTIRDVTTNLYNVHRFLTAQARVFVALQEHMSEIWISKQLLFC